MALLDTIHAACTIVNPSLSARVEYAKDILTHGFRKAQAIRLNSVDLGYDAANPGRARQLKGNASNSASSENMRNRSDAVKIMWEARNLRQNSTLMQTVLEKMAMYVCGSVRYQSLTGEKAVDAAYEKYIKKWARRCDVTGRHNLQKVTEMALMGMLVDGDFGVITTKGADEEIKLQMIEADRIGDPFLAASNRDPLEVRGVKRDEHGKPTAYIIYKRDDNARYTDPVEVSAENFIHLYNPDRPDQVRGVSAFATCIPHVRDIKLLYEAEMLAKQLSTNIAAVITGANKSGANKMETSTNAAGQTMFKPDPGFIYMSEGEDMKMFQSGRPDAAWSGFIEALIREIAGSLGLPYEFVWNMAPLGGATARVVLMQAHRCFMKYQALLVESLLQPIVVRVLQNAIARNALPAHPDFENMAFQFPAQITADVGYQTQADAQMVAMGWKTGTQVVAENGGDIREVMTTNAHEVIMAQEIGTEVGTPIELFAPQRFPDATAKLAAFAEARKPGAPPLPPEPGQSGLIANVGDAAVDTLVDTCKAVADGTLPRESAIQILVYSFEMDRVTAEFMLPPEPMQPPMPRVPPATTRASQRSARGTAPAAPPKTQNFSRLPARHRPVNLRRRIAAAQLARA